MKDSRKGPLAWFAANHVAANVLMAFILISGALSLARVVVEIFPEMDTDVVTINGIWNVRRRNTNRIAARFYHTRLAPLFHMR